MHAWVSWLQRVDTGLARLERGALVLLLSVLLGLGFFQAAWRNVFAGGFFWADELLQHIVLWLGLLGASLATYEQRHLNIDAISRLLSPSWQRRLARLTNGVACGGCLLLSHAAWSMVRSERLAGTMLTFGVATWVVQSIVPLGFLTMALRFSIRTALPAPGTPAGVVHGLLPDRKSQA